MKILALDHVVLNVADVERSVEFYQRLGLKPERLDEYRNGAVKFPSVRVATDTIIDLFPPAMHTRAAQGENMNHLCLSVDAGADELQGDLAAAGIAVESTAPGNFGARGLATSFYVRDPNGNTIELRTYRN